MGAKAALDIPAEGGRRAPNAALDLPAEGGRRAPKVARTEPQQVADAAGLEPSMSQGGATGRAAKAAARTARMDQLLADSIRKDTELYERMLLFEPIEINELRQRLAALHPDLESLGEARLRTFLDAQGLLCANAPSQRDPRPWR